MLFCYFYSLGSLGFREGVWVFKGMLGIEVVWEGIDVI